MNSVLASEKSSPQISRHPLRAAAGLLSQSALLRRSRELWASNQKNWSLPLSKWEKLQIGIHIILKDYSEGIFPPSFTDQQQAYQNEINYRMTLPGVELKATATAEMRKPFWLGRGVHQYLTAFLKLTRLLEEAQVVPPAKLLELGGGAGWTAEFLAQLGFNVVSTTISPDDVDTCLRRLESLEVRGLPVQLRFQICPMESVADHVREHCPFDVVFVHEALHHAFDWKAAVTSSFSCLRPGGWLMICHEPNVLHTAISYRVAKLSNTHEIGFRKGELVAHLRETGFRKVISRGKWPGLWVRPHWLMAQR
jgi:cyclopropane fatty-acyl-phospholipid synthase-like methyltransferase